MTSNDAMILKVKQQIVSPETTVICFFCLKTRSLIEHVPSQSVWLHMETHTMYGKRIANAKKAYGNSLHGICSGKLLVTY